MPLRLTSPSFELFTFTELKYFWLWIWEMLKRILWWVGRQDLQTRNFKEVSLLLLCRFILERQKFTEAKSKLVRIIFGTMLDENMGKSHYLLNLISCLRTCNDLWWLQNTRHGLCLQLRIPQPVSRGARISDEKK